MIDIAKNIIEVGDKVTTFYCDISGGDFDRTVLKTGIVVAISPATYAPSPNTSFTESIRKLMRMRTCSI